MIIKKRRTYHIIFACLLFSINVSAQFHSKNQDWQQYTTVEEAGFSEEAFNLLKTTLDSSQTASFLVIYKGHVLFAYGDNTRKFMLHSIRKSLMNAMIGKAIEDGTLNLDQTLKELNIDDIGQLTDQEKEATIKDLLSARSGVYHPSAYSTRGMIKNLPERGSHKAGAFWYYNNWDFNTLLTIYEQQTGKKFFEAFSNEIAQPIGMQDFEVSDGFYRTEEDKSLHPAYLFRMSARDMARFGQLYLQKGKWHNKQLISSDWIQQSTQPVTKDLRDFDSRGSYGYLWWVSSMNGHKMYNASGLGGHKIIILPENDMVIVHRVNTYENKRVGEDEINAMVALVLDAQAIKQKEVTKPALSPYIPSVKMYSTQYHGSMDQYLGIYKHRFLGAMTIKKNAQGYELQNGVGVFKLYPATYDAFYPEDIGSLIVMKKASEEQQRLTIKPIFAADKSMEKVVFYY